MIQSALAVIESATCGNGLISCMDQLTATGTYIDTFLSLRLQFTVMTIFTRLMKYGDVEVLHLLSSCGLVRVVDKYFQAAFAVVKDVPRLHQQGLFVKQYKEFVSSLREVWCVLIGTRDSRVYDDLLDVGMLRRLIQEWLPCMVSVSFGHVDPDYNPLVIRCEVVHMLQTLVLHSPESDRLVAELVRWILSSDTLRKELAALKSPSTKRGSSNARRLAAEVLSTIATLNAELIDHELIVLGVPKHLLELTVHFGCFHVSVPVMWLKWGQKESLTTGTTVSAVEDAAIEDANDDDELNAVGMEKENYDILDDNALDVVERDGRKGSTGQQRIPLDGVGKAVSDKMKDLFEKEDAAGKGQVSGAAGADRWALSKEELARVIERMGHLVLGVKTLFDTKLPLPGTSASGGGSDHKHKTNAASNNGDKRDKSTKKQSVIDAVPAQDIPGIFLDLCLGPQIFTKARALLDEHGIEELDFAGFLEFYASLCGLTTAPVFQREAKQGELPPWVPGADGLWIEVSGATAQRLRRAAEPYSVSAAAANERTPGSVFLLPPAMRVLDNADEEAGNVWIKEADLLDVLMLAGIPASEASVHSAIQQLRNFLPGILTGKFCLQEILAINEFHESNSPNDTLLGDFTSGGVGGGDTGAASRGKESTEQRLLKAVGAATVGDKQAQRSTTSNAGAGNALASSVEFEATEQRMQKLSRSAWKLPFKGRAETLPISRAAVRDEFRRLDIMGEGRLTLLNIRSALELRDVRESDHTVREWFRLHDRGEKGYVDFADYEAIYFDPQQQHQQQKKSSQRSRIDENNSNGGKGRGDPVIGSKTAAGAAAMNRDKKSDAQARLNLLRAAFDRYDVDKDGVISLEDLQNAYTEQGKAFTRSDLQAWISTRDLSGHGAVSFDDFVQHFK